MYNRDGYKDILKDVLKDKDMLFVDSLRSDGEEG